MATAANGCLSSYCPIKGCKINFGAVTLSEQESVENMAEIAAFIVEYGELGAVLFGHFYHAKDAKRAIEEATALIKMRKHLLTRTLMKILRHILR